MKTIVTRVNEAKVFVEGKLISSIGKGIVLFVGLEKKDDENILERMVEKITNFRIFEDSNKKLNYSIKDKNYEILCISNFTLCADVDKGRRPSFENVMKKEIASKLFDNFVLLLKARGLKTKTAVFGEYMDIHLNLDGPVNIVLEIPK